MKKLLFYTLASLLVLSSCKDDDTEELIDFTVAFSTDTVSLSEEDSTKEIILNYSRAAAESGTITVNFNGENAVYGTDFTTTPAGDSGSISIPVAVGDMNTTLTFTKLLDPVEGTTKSVSFSISSFSDTSWKNGATASASVSFTPIASLGGVIDVESGGSTEPNQVYIDLSTGQQTAIKRDAWEIAFHNGTENRVFLNPSLLVSAAELPGYTDINAVTSTTTFGSPIDLFSIDLATFQPTDVSVTSVSELIAGLPVGYTQYGNESEGIVFTDQKAGTLEGTAFGPISTTAEENNVFIVGLGVEIPTEAAELGSINTTGAHRGFLKVRVLSDGNSYTLQYAELDATSFEEITITKDPTKLLSAFSLVSGAAVDAEPAKEQWDLNFSNVFSFYGFSSGITAGLTYSDYALHNTLGGVGLYQVTTYEIVEGVVNTFDVPSYSDFARGDVDDSSFVNNDRTIIGSGWRNAFSGTLKDDRYYVLKDAGGNYYKINFTAFLSAEGERGNPQFVYERL